MFILYAIIVFIVGLSIGSFLNVLIMRIDRLPSVWKGRSECPACKHQLVWYDLIPLLSFLTLGGKCRYCKAKISWQYPIMEISTGLVFLLLFLKFELTFAFFFYAVLFSILLIVFVVDLKTQYVPENFVYIALVISFLGSWYFGNFSFLNMIYGGLIGMVPLFLLAALSREKWMGYGDYKIGLILGLICGYPKAILALFLSFVLGSIVGLIYIGLKRKTVKEALPFAPFLIAATFLSLMFGQGIINWYFNSYF